jgi:hypothetical protein
MGIRLTIEGAETITLDERSITSASFGTDTPDDSNARSTDVVNTITLAGKILTATDGDIADDTLKIAKWSVVKAENADSYRKGQWKCCPPARLLGKSISQTRSSSGTARRLAIRKASGHFR